MHSMAIPPRMGMAIGRMISLPGDVDHTAGKRAAMVVTVVIMSGRILWVPALIMQFFNSLQFWGCLCANVV